MAHFTCAAGRAEVAGIEHRPQNPAVHRLQSVPGIGQGPGDDDRHGVLEEGVLHLRLDLDRLDVVEPIVTLGIGSVGRWNVAHEGFNSTGFGQLRSGSSRSEHHDPEGAPHLGLPKVERQQSRPRTCTAGRGQMQRIK